MTESAAPAATPAALRPSPHSVRVPVIRERWRSAWRWLRNAPDCALHSLRRRTTLGALKRHGWPDAVVFVCQGNIYRSPYGAVLLAASLLPARRDRMRIESAGFIGPGRPSPDDAQALARERLLDLSAHRSRQLSAPMLEGRTICVVMDPVQITRVRASEGYNGQLVLNLGDLDPEAITARAIPDPWSGEPAVLRASYARIERCVAVLAEALLGTAI